MNLSVLIPESIPYIVSKARTVSSVGAIALFVGWRHRWQARLDAVDSRSGQSLGDPKLVVRGEFDTCLLLIIPEGHIVNLHRLRNREVSGDLR